MSELGQIPVVVKVGRSLEMRTAVEGQVRAAGLVLGREDE